MTVRSRTAPALEAATTTTRVLCTPGALENPYQRLLAAALVPHGFALRLAPLTWRVEDAHAAGEGVLHLHWLAPLLVDARRARTALKLALFARGLRRLQARGVALVWTVHNLYEHERRHVALERRLRCWLAQRADALIVHGPAAAARVRREYGVPERTEVALVPHGHYFDAYSARVERPEARRRLGLDPARAVVLFLGQVRAYKGVRALVDAVAAVPGLQLVVAGRPSPPELATELRAAARGRADVHLRLAHVPDEEVGLLLAAADLVALPHKEILTSGSAVLAMSHGRPCVAPRTECFVELLGDEGAFLYDGDAPAGLAGALRAALDARGRWEAMGSRNRAALEPFGWDRVAAATAAVYARARAARALS